MKKSGPQKVVRKIFASQRNMKTLSYKKRFFKTRMYKEIKTSRSLHDISVETEFSFNR